MDLKKLIEKIELLGSKADSEENLKIHVISWMLRELGYDEQNFDYEHPLCRDKNKDMHADIFISIDKNTAMFIETKKYSKDLDENDILQLLGYMMIHQGEITWGILTNGRQIILLCNGIDVETNKGKNEYRKRIVMNIQMNPVTRQFKNAKYIKYLTMESIFETHVTNYFRAVAQFLAKHPLSSESEEKYKNTLWRFFDYYITKGNEYKIFGDRLYAPLEDITDRDFVEFLKQIEPITRKASGKVPLAKCSHIYTMYDILEKNGHIAKNTMKNVRDRAKSEYEKAEFENKFNNILTSEDIRVILDKLSNKPYKIIIFTLVAYYGLSRENVSRFLSESWSIIDWKNHIFMLNGKKYPLIRIIEENLLKMQNEYRIKGIKKPSAIYVYKKKDKYSAVSANSISAVFEEIKHFTEIGSDCAKINPQNSRAAVIYNMLCAGCTIEEIAYITDATLSQLIKYLPDEIVKRNGEKQWKSKSGGRYKHPFKELFD